MGLKVMFKERLVLSVMDLKNAPLPCFTSDPLTAAHVQEGTFKGWTNFKSVNHLMTNSGLFFSLCSSSLLPTRAVQFAKII